MSIQAQLDQVALDKMKISNGYIETVSENRAGHHNNVLLREILNSNKALDNMNKVELKMFDMRCLRKLKYLDNIQ